MSSAGDRTTVRNGKIEQIPQLSVQLFSFVAFNWREERFFCLFCVQMWAYTTDTWRYMEANHVLY